MTREKFIKKWLGNKDYQYTEQNRDLMRDDLDEVINQALRQPAVMPSLPNGKRVLSALKELSDCFTNEERKTMLGNGA
jgi:hypothetical protein